MSCYYYYYLIKLINHKFIVKINKKNYKTWEKTNRTTNRTQKSHSKNGEWTWARKKQIKKEDEQRNKTGELTKEGGGRENQQDERDATGGVTTSSLKSTDISGRPVLINFF